MLFIFSYIIFAFILVAIFVLLARLFFVPQEPSFSMGKEIEGLDIKESIAVLANKEFAKKGRGLGFKGIATFCKKAFRAIEKRVENGETIEGFENWIYDNYYKVVEKITEIRKINSNFRKIPHIDRLPRLYLLLSNIIKVNDGECNYMTIKKMVDVFNEISPLNYTEILQIKSMLTFILLEVIAIYSNKCVRYNSDLFSSYYDANKEKVDLSLFFNVFYLSNLYEFSSDVHKRKILKLCLTNDLDIGIIKDNAIKKLGSYEQILSTSFKSLHNLEKEFASEKILGFSKVHEFLAGDQGILYNQVTEDTKYSYLCNIYKSSRRHVVTELKFAETATEFSKKTNQDIAHYILPEAKPVSHMRFFIFMHFLVALGLAATIGFFANSFRIVVGSFSFPILFVAVSTVINKIASKIFKTPHLPIIEIDENDVQNNTIIVVPRLVYSNEEIENAFINLETIIAANPSRIFSYALLFDFKNADEKTVDKDLELLECCKSLKEKSIFSDRIVCLVRDRVKLANSKQFGGYEKKRGALIDFNSAMLSNDFSKFTLALGDIKKCSFVITLDCDTLLNSAIDLIKALQHPFNSNVNVMSIQTRTQINSERMSPFSRLFCGSRGLSRYDTTNNSVSNSLWHRGNFTGKGAYRLKKFSELTENRFLDNRVLCHDFIEGAFANCRDSNVCAVDSFPQNFSEFILREQRWQRGDTQLLPFLCNKTKNKQGEKIKNSISPLCKFLIMSNIIRPLVPIFTLGLLIIGFFSYMPWLAWGIALLPYALALLLSLGSSLYRRNLIFFVELARQFFIFVALPTIVLIALTAFLVTIFRLMSKRKLLEWKTFSHQKARVIFYPSAIFAIMLIVGTYFFSLSILGYVLAGLFVFGIFLEILLSGKSNKKSKMNEGLREIINDEFNRIYSFFESNFRPEYNYLPFDNIQFEPTKRIAERTSPTNIGFALIAVACAFEAKIISHEELHDRISKIVTSIEKLEKFEGNLYNWYDIKSLQVLSPKFISSVDSGNLLISLVLISQIVSDYDLLNRINSLINNTKIEKLFDKRRKLFSIGYMADRLEFDNANYDLIASEAMATHALAVGLGKVPHKSFYNLSTQSLKSGSGSPYASWTGGMFEYLMPTLFFDYPKCSMLYKKTKDAIRAHIRYAKKQKLSAWGISESQYFRQDGDGNYQYKAFGVPQISLSNAECAEVVAPYASLMCVPFGLDNVLKKNLMRLKDEGLRGKLGFYEAKDYKENKVLKTYMSHHMGMALCAICNTLFDNAIIKRMYKSPYIRASSLVMLDKNKQKARKKRKICLPAKIVATPKVRVFSDKKTIPNINLISNDGYGVVFDDWGGGYAIKNGELVYREASKELVVRIDGKCFSLINGKFIATHYSNEFEKEFCGLKAAVKARLLANGIGEIKEITIYNISDIDKKIEFVSKIDPVLREGVADKAHRAYSDLFLQSEHIKESNVLVMYRKTAKKPIYITHFMQEASNYVCNTSRAAYYGRTKEELVIEKYPLEPCISLHSNVIIAAKNKKVFYVYTVVDYDKGKLIEQVNVLQKLNVANDVSIRESAVMKKEYPAGFAMELARKLIYAPYIENANCDDNLLSDIKESWVKPTVCLELKGLSGIKRLKNKLFEICKLYKFGLTFDLCIIYDEPKSYFQKSLEILNDALSELSFVKRLGAGCEVRLINEWQEPLKAKIIRQRNLLEFGAVAKSYKNFTESTLFSGHNFDTDEKVAVPHSLGGFTASGGYISEITRCTPRPWCNILANKHMGTIVSESGGGFSFYDSSYYKKISHWSNDAILDKPSEYVTISDGVDSWRLTREQSAVNAGAKYFFNHELGYTELSCFHNNIKTTQKIYLSDRDAIKFVDIEITNKSTIVKKITLEFCVDAVLGDFKKNSAYSICVSKNGNNSVKVTNFQNGMTFFMVSDRQIAYYARKGSVILSKSEPITVLSNQTVRVIFSIGSTAKVDFEKCSEILGDAKKQNYNLSCIGLEGYSQTALLAKWLPYQVLNSRFFAKAGFYQAGGAIGFRDQLQDCLTLLYVNPSLVKQHILDCAARQFEKGDVLHWWHPFAKGVRTRMTDDRLFLPIVTFAYVDFTGDVDILKRRIPYLLSQKIPENHSDLYFDFKAGDVVGTLLEHCEKAIEVSFDFAASGLCKIGTGDWNDAMDKLGAEGKGASMFTTMLLCHTIQLIIPHIISKTTKNLYLKVFDKLKKVVNWHYRDGRFIRAITDEGEIIGGVGASECSLDMLVQSWASLSGTGDIEKTKSALRLVYDVLIDKEKGVAKLLAPPFENKKYIGYIADYPPGVRENGGQYSHAAAWFVLALIKEGMVVEAWEVFNMMNPINLTDTIDKQMRYKNEPYVLSADVYTTGQGGWSWYTGAASWYYKCLVEGFMGIKIKGSKIWVEPNLPFDAESMKFTLRHNENVFSFFIDNSNKKGEWKYKIDKVFFTGNGLELGKSLVGKNISIVRHG